ncbi:hypothetical protein [Niabella hibiscisoli]|uniref:hypothetical protein n=1 Tax=Niabella hibiscisoli TaxID=1825928 RepID=UPI001F10887F|nr:hypothetical protein [Niabella hibiscisoli]MCH5719149.1 hypothetical protein [Niabella hibiscisoli]
MSDKLNADEESALPKQPEDSGVATGSQNNRTVSLDNVEELKEVTIGAISRAIKMMGYGNSTVSGFVFHSRFADNAIENVAVNALTKDADFIKQIKRTLKSRNTAYKENFTIEVLNNSALTDKVTPIIEGMGVEVLIRENRCAK